MNFVALKIPGAFRIELSPRQDQRGFFVRTYDERLFQEKGLVTRWVQESHSFSKSKGTLRGLHFQKQPYAETKLVRAASGKIFMAMLDLRKDSVTFRQWDTVVLSADQPQLLYVPQGLALGMYTLTENCILLYKMDREYHPESAQTIRWDDRDIGIRWPLEGKPVISEKDAAAPGLREYLESL